MKKKLFITIFLLIILITNISFASYSTVTMEVVEEPVATIQIEENSKFEKKLISKDLMNKEVTIQLQVTNNEKSEDSSAEIVFVLDNSDSMLIELENGKTRKDVIFESAQSIITSLLKDNSDLKIGVVSFSTSTNQEQEATIADANLVSKLSNNATTLNNAISAIEATGPRTNLQSGLLLASQQFTEEDNNKYMIVLTDGVPNVAIDYDKHYYSDDVINKTISQLQALQTKNINLITMLTKVEDETAVPAGVTKTYGEIISEIFGTTTNPKFGHFYYVSDDEIETTIKEDIYNSLVTKTKSLKDIKIVDYFPAETIKNFDFSYVSKANIGDISATVNTTDNSIVWTIPELKYGETATVQYKLKLKENFDSSIVDKILNTNKNVNIDYTDLNDEKQSDTTDITPKLKLSEPPAVLPQTGTFAIIGFIVMSIGLIVFSVIKLTRLYKDTH